MTLFLEILTDSYVTVLIHALLLFLIIYVYQHSQNLTINYKRILLLSILGSIITIIPFVYFSSSALWLAIAILFILSMLLYLYNLDNYLQISYYCLFVITLTFIGYVLFLIFFDREPFIDSYSYFSYTYSLFFTTIILATVVYIIDLKFTLPTNRISIFILLTSGSILFIELLFLDQFPNIATWTMANFIIYIIVCLLCFCNNILIQYLYNDFYQLNIALQNNFLSKITASYINNLKANQNEILKIKHDIKNNIIILHQLLCNNNIDEAITILKEINHRLNIKNQTAYTGNIIIDAYLNNVTNDSNISLQIRSNDLNDLNYQADILALIVNLVDNAVENAQNKVIINFDYQKEDNLLIKVANDCISDPSKHLKKSTKQGDHGYGLQIVHEVVIKHAGTYLTSYQDNLFTTYILLNLGG